MRRAQPRGDVIHQLVFIRPHDRQARMVGYIPKQAGQQFPSPEMCRCYHAGALSSFETLQQIRALHVEQGWDKPNSGTRTDSRNERALCVKLARASDSAVACEVQGAGLCSPWRDGGACRHVQSREPSPWQANGYGKSRVCRAEGRSHSPPGTWPGKTPGKAGGARKGKAAVRALSGPQAFLKAGDTRALRLRDRGYRIRRGRRRRTPSKPG